MKEVVLVEAVRTPIGKFGGSLRNVNAEELAAIAIKSVLERAGVAPEEVDCVIFGQTRQSSQANNLARVALLKTDIPIHATAYTINMLCGSGMKAIDCGAAEIMLGKADVVVAGGTENMSQSPYYLRNARFGEKSLELVDSNIEGGLGAVPMDIYGKNLSMGVTGENVAEKYGVSREEQDQFAFTSQQRYAAALEQKLFEAEIVPVEVQEKKDKRIFAEDEFPRPGTTLEKLAKLKPSFREGGTVTAGNACGRNDGAAAVLLMSREKAESLGLKPIARFLGCAEAGVPPEIMGIGPIPATEKVLKQVGLTVEQIDLVELNEAFASQALVSIRELGLDPEKVNVNGGAIALGHPLGCTGARIVTTLVYEMKRRQAKYGLATQCIGGGQGIASVWELLA